MNRVLVVIPALDEAGSIAAVVDEVRRTNAGVDVVVVDDGSTDGTATLAGRAGAAVLQLPFNLGVGGAMRAGYRFARDNGYDVAVQVDADGQHDPAEIPRLLEALVGADIAIGARFAGRGDYAARGPRRWAMRFLARALSRLCRTRLTDATSGFRAVNRAGIALWAANYPAEYLGDTIESLVMAARSGLRVAQVPVAMRPRQAGAPSQSPLKATIYLARAGLVLLLARIRRMPQVAPS